MDAGIIAKRCAALGHAGRLETVRVLAATSDGLSAAEVAASVGVARPLMAAHLKTLASVQLLTSERRGREVVYRVDRAELAATLDWLEREVGSRSGTVR